MTYRTPKHAYRALATCTALSLCLTATAWAQTFGGTFMGDGLTLVLKPVPRQPNRYTGTVALGGQKFPAKGQFSANRFTGTFQSGGTSFPFSLQRSGTGLALTSGDTTYNLRSQSGTPNPLARSAPNPISHTAPNPLAPAPSSGITTSNAKDKAGYLGLAAMMDDAGQMRVFGVVVDGPAQRAGLRSGDIIRQIAGKAVTDEDQMTTAMRGPVGSRVPMQIGREGNGGAPKQFNVVVVRTLMPTAGRPQDGDVAPISGGTGNAPQLGATGSAGYLGMATEMLGNQMSVYDVAQGSPAQRAGLQHGDIIRTIDGHPITTDDQMRAALPGPVGSRVTLQVARESDGATKQFNVTMVRGPRPTGGPEGAMTPGETPDAPPNNDQSRNNIGGRQPFAQRPMAHPASPRFAQAKRTPKRPAKSAPKRTGTRTAKPQTVRLAAGQFPSPLNVGMRLVYSGGNAVVQGASSRLVPSGDGQWQDPQGRRWRQEDLESSGGVGYVTLDIVQTTPNFIAADVRNILIGFNNATSLSGTSLVTGNAATLGDSLLRYWIAPARLAKMPTARGGGHQVSRVRYLLGGRTYNALSISDTSEAAYANEIYDLQTGLLLASSRSNRGDNQHVLQGTQMGAAPGAVVMSHLRLVSTRKRQLPWNNSPAPGWAQAGRRLDYQGQVQNVMANSGLPPFPPTGASFSCVINRVIGGCVLASTLSREDSGAGLPPQEAPNPRVYASTSIGSLWVPPTAIGRLQPNQVIDQDPITKFRVTYAGIQNGAAIFTEQGPVEQFIYAYNPQTGMLVGFNTTTRPANMGEQRRQFRLTSGG